MRFVAAGIRFKGGGKSNTFFATITASALAILIFFMLPTQARAQETETKESTMQVNRATDSAVPQAGEFAVKAKNRSSKEATVISEQTTEVIQTQVQGKEFSQLKPFPEIGGGKVPQTRASDVPSPLASVETITRDTNEDRFTDLIIVPRNCKAREGASLVLEDDDGTQGTFVDNTNIQINETQDSLRVVSSPPEGPNPPDPIRAVW